MTGRLAFAATLTLAVGALAAQPSKPQTSAPQGFLKANCIACHNGTTKEGKLDLTTLSFQLEDPKVFAAWVKVHDRVQAGEMPPNTVSQPRSAARAAFLKALATPMLAQEAARTARQGRSTWRRMNRYEYENTLRDLLNAPWLQVKEMLPEDGEAFRFNKVGDALDVSYVQMSRYLTAAEYALKELAAQANAPAPTTRRFYSRQQSSFTGPMVFNEFNGSPERATFPLLDSAADVAVLERKAPLTTPENREREAVGVVASAYEPLEPTFNRFRAPAAGRYKLRVSAYSFWAGPESERNWWRPSRTNLSKGRTQEPINLYGELPPRLLRRLGTVEVGPDPSVQEIEVTLLKGETIRPDAARFFRSRPPGWHNPLAKKDGQPGVAFRWLEVEGPLEKPSTRLLFGDTPPTAAELEPCLRAFVQRAYRRPLRSGEVEPFVKLAKLSLANGDSPQAALLTAYSAVLCSPAFVTLEEKPGPLDDFALAARLSYFLWNSEPDTTLRTLAAQGTLHQPTVLRAQTDRLLADPKAQRFVAAFLDYWLDLRKVSIVSPDEVLYCDYYLDDYLLESATEETQHFFATLIRGNLPARNLVESDFVTINARLAEHYGIPGVQGVALQKVSLPPDSVRGGLLTQASVLKVTANGTNTSPVVRGAWITERILGQPVPPPPAAVPAVEPDIRGATTIRQQLDKHRTDPTCRSCHAKIDPPGFALESFDVCGGWRERYRALGSGDKVPGYGKNGQPFPFHPGPTVDPTGTLPDGRAFQDIKDLKHLLAKDERGLARNLARQLITYATGAPVGFGDRPQLTALLDKSAPSHYGVSSLIHAIVESELFRNK